MSVMHVFIGLTILILLFSFFKVIQGPSIWDRLLGFNLVSTKIMAVVILYASVSNISFLLDLAIIYALFAFIGEIFIALFAAERARRGEEN